MNSFHLLNFYSIRVRNVFLLAQSSFISENHLTYRKKMNMIAMPLFQVSFAHYFYFSSCSLKRIAFFNGRIYCFWIQSYPDQIECESSSSTRFSPKELLIWYWNLFWKILYHLSHSVLFKFPCLSVSSNLSYHPCLSSMEFCLLLIVSHYFS